LVIKPGNYSMAELAAVLKVSALEEFAKYAYITASGVAINILTDVKFDKPTGKFEWFFEDGIAYGHGYYNEVWVMGADADIPGVISNTTVTMGKILGITYGESAGTDELSNINWSFAHNQMADYYGGTSMIYLTSPTLFDSNCVCSNNPVLNTGMMAKIPVSYNEANTVQRPIKYTPTASQMYNFQYSVARSFDIIEIVAYAHREPTPVEAGGYYEINFNGHDISLTIELVILDTI